MSTKIFYNDNRIIIDGHADTPEECQAITAMCDSLANDENFKTVVYEKGHAVFERVDGGDAMMFAMMDYVLTARYNSEVGENYSHALSIIERLDEVETRSYYLEDKIYHNTQAIEGLIPRLAALEADALGVRLAQIESQLAALENKATKSLPYTADELITKLESI